MTTRPSGLDVDGQAVSVEQPHADERRRVSGIRLHVPSPAIPKGSHAIVRECRLTAIGTRRAAVPASGSPGSTANAGVTVRSPVKPVSTTAGDVACLPAGSSESGAEHRLVGGIHRAFHHLGYSVGDHRSDPVPDAPPGAATRRSRPGASYAGDPAQRSRCRRRPRSRFPRRRRRPLRDARPRLGAGCRARRSRHRGERSPQKAGAAPSRSPPCGVPPLEDSTRAGRVLRTDGSAESGPPGGLPVGHDSDFDGRVPSRPRSCGQLRVQRLSSWASGPTRGTVRMYRWRSAPLSCSKRPAR